MVFGAVMPRRMRPLLGLRVDAWFREHCEDPVAVVMDGVSYTVTGATRKRGQICYLLTDATGQRQALETKRLLEGQRDQWLQVKVD